MLSNSVSSPFGCLSHRTSLMPNFGAIMISDIVIVQTGIRRCLSEIFALNPWLPKAHSPQSPPFTLELHSPSCSSSNKHYICSHVWETDSELTVEPAMYNSGLSIQKGLGVIIHQLTHASDYAFLNEVLIRNMAHKGALNLWPVCKSRSTFPIPCSQICALPFRFIVTNE